MSKPVDTVFIPALLSDEEMYHDVTVALYGTIVAHVMLSPLPSMQASVSDILARAPSSFALVGTSYGGMLALEVALAAPERVTALWLMGCDPAGPKQGGPDLAKGLTATPDAVIDMLSGLVVAKAATEEAALFKAMAQRVGGEAGAAQALALQGRQETISRLKGLTIPTLVVWGDEDALVPVEIGRGLANGLSHAHFHVLKGCGHLPTFERPAECAALFREFLNNVARMPMAN